MVLKKIEKINNNTDNFDHLHPVKSLAQMNFLEKSISWCYLKKDLAYQVFCFIIKCATEGYLSSNKLV